MNAISIRLFTTVFGASVFSLSAAEPFTVYAPSRATETLQIVRVVPGEGEVVFAPTEPVALGFAAATITAHPEKPLLYVAGNRDGNGATLALAGDGSVTGTTIFETANGYSYLSTDRAANFLLGCSYGEGVVDVYELDETGSVGPRVSTVDEGRKAAHCVLPSPDNRSVYIPYVKDSNALFQYHFDPETGGLTPMERLDAGPPAGTGPRHLAYHPTLPLLYFSNEQHLGVSVYERAESGLLTLKQVCDLPGGGAPAEGVSSSDIVITPDGKFVFAGIRGHQHEFDFISRYRVEDDGTLVGLGRTEADKIPWGLALSPDGGFLCATGFEAASLMVFRIGDEGELERVGTHEWDKQISDLVTR